MTAGTPPFAERISRLGTETAFAVGAECAAWAAKGNKVYPFHLGDIDLATPRNIVEAADRAIAERRTATAPTPASPSCGRRSPTSSRRRTAWPTAPRTWPSSPAASR